MVKPAAVMEVWITLLHSLLATQQGGGSTVEIPQCASLASVMSLNEFPQDIPPLWQGRVGGGSWRVGSLGQNCMAALKEHVHQMLSLHRIESIFAVQC